MTVADPPPPAGDELPGQRIGIGRTAEVFEWGSDDVLKLLRPGFPDIIGEREADIAARVDAAGLAAPHFRRAAHVDGRYGLVYERLRGPSMLDQLSARPWSVDRLARRFAELHAEMHRTDGSGLPELRGYMRGAIGRAAGELGDDRLRRVLAHLEAMPAGSIVCHGDMHPGNVILTGAGPIVIDWMTATSGPPEADVTRTRFLLTGSAVPGVYPRVQRSLIGMLRRRFDRSYLRRYRELRPVDDRLLASWRLPVLAARLAEEVEEETAGLLREIDAELARS